MGWDWRWTFVTTRKSNIFAANHVLLQRVGGGYRFVHALLLDYLADQWPDLPATLPKGDA